MPQQYKIDRQNNQSKQKEITDKSQMGLPNIPSQNRCQNLKGKIKKNLYMIFLLIMVLTIQWNTQSLIAHGNELKNALNDFTEKPDIIYIQETCLKKERNFNIPGYNIL